MDLTFQPDEDQQLMLDNLQELLDRVAPDSYVAKCDEEHRLPLELRQALYETGYLSLGIPEEHGGVPATTETVCLVTEKIAAHGINMGYGLDVIAVHDVLDFGTEEQQKGVFAELAQGNEPFALCITEPGAGSDNARMSTTAVHKDGKVVINGTKTLVTNAVLAKYLLVVAIDPDAEPKDKYSMYLVERETPGISQDPLTKVGWWTIDSSEIHFDNVEVPESTLVGAKGAGFLQLMKNLEIERIVICAIVLGLAQAAFDDAATYAGQRVAFGQPIGNFQMIQEKLTDMATAIENMRALTYRGAALIDSGGDPKVMAAMAKRYCAQKAFWVADEAMQIYGGVGYTTGTRVARIWRDLRGHRFGGGTDEIMVHIVGRQVVKDHLQR